MKRLIFVLCMASASLADATDQNLAEGQPPLTRAMVNQLAAVLTEVLDTRLSPDQYARFEQGVVQYWRERDRQAMDQVLSNLRYARQREELASLRRTGQQTLLDSLRLDTKDPVSVVLVEAYDASHPRANRRPKDLSDLAGVWKRQDGLLADRYRDGRTVGVSYTDSGALEISASGQFKYVRVHNHCSGGSRCCTQNASTEEGVISLDGAQLVFDVRSGSEMVEDGCSPALNHRGPVKPRIESFPWSLRPNPDRGSEPTLCWNTSPDAAVCFAKETLSRPGSQSR